MRATMIHGPGDIRVSDVDDPAVQLPTDAVVRVVAACVCGSDLWPYRGVGGSPKPQRIGHEFVGVVEETGSAVAGLREGQFVIAPFVISDGTCVHCRNGVHTSCENGGSWGHRDAGGRIDGGQGQRVRVPQADGTLVPVGSPGEEPDVALVPHLLTLSDVMGTGHHAALSARVQPGDTVVVVGDGAVGQCAALAAGRLGAGRVIMMSRHEPRQALARRFGAGDVVAERGEEGAAAVKDLLGGVGADAVLECVGTQGSFDQALACVRPGGRIGFVGLPHDVTVPLIMPFLSNVALAGGIAPTRAYIEQLLPEVLDGTLTPGDVFDRELPLEEAPEAYRAMDSREAIKVLLRP